MTSSATPADPAVRVLAGIGGTILLLAGGLFTGGAALAGAVGILLLFAIVRSRGRRVGVWGAWWSAVASVLLYVVVALTLLFQSLPGDTVDRMTAAADSAAKESRPPAWVERLFPDAVAAEQARAQSHEQADPSTDTAAKVGAVIGGIIGLNFVVGLIAGISWGSVMLLSLAFRGRWIGRG